MTQVDAQHQQDQHAILRDVLHIIATNPEPQSSIPPILEAARTLTSATGASLLVFSEPYLRITMGEAESALPPAEEAKLLALALPYGVHINPPLPEAIPALQGGWVVAQIRIQKQIVGLFWLVFDSKPEFSESAMQGVQSMVDGLTIVTMNTRAIARHEKLGRNQSEFMRIVSHDLRSPLTSIQGFASMLEQGTVGDINERQAHFVEKILSGVNQMTLLVDNFQDAGRYDPETGFYEMERSHCDLTEMVSRIIKNYLVPAEKQELSVSAVISDDVPIISADVNMLERAIINLVDNAIKYTPNGGKVEVGVRRRNDQVIVSVKDSGLGISAEHQKMLFERHFRIPRREHKKVKGSGLGLFIVRSVAQRHGGQAWVESVEGQGSTFFISIPLDSANSIISDGS